MHGACHASTQVGASILQLQTYILGASYLYNCLVVTWTYSALIVQTTRVKFTIGVYIQCPPSQRQRYNIQCPTYILNIVIFTVQTTKIAINILRLTQQSTVTN